MNPHVANPGTTPHSSHFSALNPHKRGTKPDLRDLDTVDGHDSSPFFSGGTEL